MSKEIICKECGFENPHSSKFCNNCGAKLPLSTHIICPNCETPNTRDRIFCDTCGTRLIVERPQPKPEEPAESQPPVNKPFSLPVRRPGDTGELNPNAVPDWLRTGDIAAGKEADEVPPGKRGTADLPDWLVHDSDPDPIINAPTTISTEFYKDLLDRAEDLPQPDDLFPDEEGANLPDWLSDADTEAGSRTANAEASSGLTDWLSELGDEESGEETAVAKPEDDLSSGLTDWLNELDDLANPAETHAAKNTAALEEMLDDLPQEETEASDWLDELGPAQTDLFPKSTKEAELGEETPDWMDELGPLQTNLLDPSQIAQLTGPLTGISDEADIVDDEEAGADVSFTSLFAEAGTATETLPDWLDEATEAGKSFLTSLDKEPVDADEPEVVSEAGSDWFTADQIVAETDLGWLEETGSLDSVADEEDFGELLLDADSLEDKTAVSLPDTPEEDSDDTFDFEAFLAEPDEEEPFDVAMLEADDDDLGWLSDMEAIETGQLVVAPAPEETAVPEDDIWHDLAEETALAAEELESEDLPELLAEAADDEWDDEALFEETAVGEDLPDWLSRLDEADQPDQEASAEEPVNEELPDWIASMRPSSGFVGSELPGVLSEIDIRDTLEGIPEELAGAELPEWLQDTPLDSSPPKLFDETPKEGGLPDIPDWLQPRADEQKDTAVSTPGTPIEPASPQSSRNEWRSLLEELPPMTPLAESLPKADIPEWVQQLKPTELTGQPPRMPDGPEETTGPLKGMQGVVAIEPSIARPRTASPLMTYVTTPEQQQQVALLQQIAQEAPDTVASLDTKTAYYTAVWLRILLALLLIVGLIAGLLGPSLVATQNAAPPAVQAVDAVVAAAAGQPVLVAVEYTPAMAGELSSQTRLFLNQLQENGSPVIITSQYAAGTAVASNLLTDAGAHMVGYLPGEGIGLRQLGDCLAQRNACEQLNGRMLDTATQANLQQTSLVIILTGDRDNLVNWVEQVGTVATDVPVVAGVTQALTPLAKSYTATGQLTGLLGGIPDAAAYERLHNSETSGLQSQLNAQIFGQLVAATLLLAGLFVYGVTNIMNSRRSKK